MEEKRFLEWIKLKTLLHFKGAYRSIKEGDVWWCSIGENVGIEINGKQQLFLRPVVVLRKLGRFGFMGIPLTSQPHSGSWYIKFEFQNKVEYGALAQSRVMSVF